MTTREQILQEIRFSGLVGFSTEPEYTYLNHDEGKMVERLADKITTLKVQSERKEAVEAFADSLRSTIIEKLGYQSGPETRANLVAKGGIIDQVAQEVTNG